jgi:hypothetical protein
VLHLLFIDILTVGLAMRRSSATPGDSELVVAAQAGSGAGPASAALVDETGARPPGAPAPRTRKRKPVVQGVSTASTLAGLSSHSS